MNGNSDNQRTTEGRTDLRSGDGFIIRQLEASSVAVSERMAPRLGDPDIEDRERRAVVDLLERAMADGKVRLPDLRRGLGASGYHPGPLGPADVEGTVRDFCRHMARRLGWPPARAVARRRSLPKAPITFPQAFRRGAGARA